MAIDNTYINQLITFQSKNNVDQVKWRGTVVAVGMTAALASGYTTDIVSYNGQVRQSDPSVPADPTTLTYFVIKLDNNASPSQLRAFSEAWILPNTLQIIKNSVTVNIAVYASPVANGDYSAIISALKAGGYTATITNVIS